jgi:TolA-binding protein
MVFFRRWFLIWFALILGGGQLFAATREERAYAAALAAFNDKFYERAEAGLTQFLQTYRKSTNAPAAVLRLAQAEFYLGHFSAASSRLADPVNLAKAKAVGLGDRYVYWRAEAQFAGGDFAGAAQTFISLPEHFPDSPLGLSAVVEAAAAYQKLGQWQPADELLDNTNGLFQHAANLDPANEAVASGRLLQSESKCAQQDFAAALQTLRLLNPATLTPEQDWKRAHQLYRVSVHLDDLDAAQAATTNLLQIARAGQGDVWAAKLAESVACRADVLERQGRLAEAGATWRENLTNNVPVGQQQEAVLKMAELAAAQNNLTNAEAGLELYLAQFTNAPAAENALLTLGKLHLQDILARPAATNELAAAQGEFDQFLAVSTNGPLAARAFLNRGWCHWLANEYPECLADFQSAARLLPVSEDLVVARFKMGDAQFALQDFAGAQTNYQAVLTDFSALTNVVNALADRALYQILRARLALHDTNGMDETMSRLLGKFFTSAPADSSLLLAGEGFSDFGAPAKARAVFRGFEIERADSPLLPQVAFALARTFEREQNWPTAVTNYQDWLKAYPANELRPQVEYARNWAVAQTGDEAGAFERFTNFISEFPTNALKPLALWWLADHYFRLGGTNLVAAELNYELIFQDFPTNRLAYPAQLMAGHAAMGRFNYTDASRYFVALINTTNYLEDAWVKANLEDWRVKAKFGYCEALRQMASSDTNSANLQLATNILAQVCPMAATNVAGALAWSEIGDCDLQLGALDAATNAYAQVLTAAAADGELRGRARVGLGIVLEKKAEGLPADAQQPLLDQALANYWAAFHPDEEIKDEFWRKKAGLRILSLAAKIGGLKGDKLDNFINDLKTIFPQLKDSPELKRLALKN